MLAILITKMKGFMYIFYWNDPFVTKHIESDLLNGNIVLSSTDTVLGLMACFSKEGLEALNTLKGRDLFRANLVLVDSLQKASQLIVIPSGSIIEKLAQCWPAPLTLIGKACKGVDPSLCSSAGTIGVRIPNHLGLLGVLKKFDALFSTSANIHGEPIPTQILEISPRIKEGVSCMVFDDPFKERYEAVSSTIVDCTGDSLKVIRHGLFDIDSFLLNWV